MLAPLNDDEIRIRVAEYHRYAPGGALPDPMHYDLDSLVTIDCMLSDPEVDFEGAPLATCYRATGIIIPPRIESTNIITPRYWVAHPNLF